MAVSVSKRAGLALVMIAGLTALAGCDTRMENYDSYTLSGNLHELPPHPVSAIQDGPKFTFMPVVGAPTNRGDILYRLIRDRLQKNNITVIPGLDDPTTYRVVLNLSAVATNVSTTLVYEVDIHDATGARIHHFGGQVMGSPGTDDPWSGVNRPALREAAAQIDGSIRQWLYGRR
jgi:hypothetical protein